MLFPATPLLAFFESPAMLGWMAAASAPLIIHLLNKRKFQESSWAAMQFLLAAMRKNSRRVLIEQWLLLALRTLIILLFVLAAAQPGLRSIGLTTPTAERTHRIVVVDQCWPFASVASEVVTQVCERCFDYLDHQPVRVNTEDVPTPYAKALEYAYLPNKEKIVSAIKSTIAG